MNNFTAQLAERAECVEVECVKEVTYTN